MPSIVSLHFRFSILTLFLMLKMNYLTIIAKAADVSAETDTLVWWQRHKGSLPYWTGAFRKVLLVQPSSAAAERVFSLLKASFSD